MNLIDDRTPDFAPDRLLTVWQVFLVMVSQRLAQGFQMILREDGNAPQFSYSMDEETEARIMADRTVPETEVRKPSRKTSLKP